VLYLISLSGLKSIHFLPPLGGLAWIAGWLIFAFALWRR
jgi:uncharacterized membrane protein YgdD (TMEM256/DUF423 family)